VNVDVRGLSALCPDFRAAIPGVLSSVEAALAGIVNIPLARAAVPVAVAIVKVSAVVLPYCPFADFRNWSSLLSVSLQNIYYKTPQSQ